MKRAMECTRQYKVVRIEETEVDWLVNIVTLETVEMTWTEFMKHVKKHYCLKESRKRYGYAVVQ